MGAAITKNWILNFQKNNKLYNNFLFMFRSTPFKIAVIVLFALFLGYFNLPSSLQKAPFTPQSVLNSRVHLGLDLQGGSQLDYKIDLRRVPEKDKKMIVEGVKTVINKRVNALGVSEPNIYTSKVGEEEHLIVELAGVKDLNQAKKIVGKTIQLEFKEEKAGEDPKYKENMRRLAESILKRVNSEKETFEFIGQEENLAAPEKIQFTEEDWKFSEEISDKKIRDAVENTKIGVSGPNLIEGNNGYTAKDEQLVPLEGFFIIKPTDKRDTSALPEKDKAVQVSHILIAYRGADRAADSVVRSKDEAKTEAENLLKQLKEGRDFAAAAKELSDEPGAKDSAGKLSQAVKSGGAYVESFTSAALKLSKAGELSGVVESLFGFHIIRADDFTQYKYSYIFVSTAPDPWQSTGLTGLQFQHAQVDFDQFMQPVVSIKFNDEGSKLFEEITGRNVNKKVAIFVGGSLISAPNVNEKISGGSAQISGKFSIEEAQALARDLNTGAIPAPVLLSGQYTIGATLGETALQKSMKAGIIGILIVIIFMIIYYRLPGLIATFALTLYTGILLFMIKSELPLPLALAAALVIFVAIVYKILQSKDGGWEKFISFVLACFILFFVTFLLSNAIVLTLAGVAGVILSIGMAVDANILIFERTKEELSSGRPLSSAVDVGFDRAWSSIRDSNFSSLITCAILYNFGSSIIQGFAFNLAAGILISMFTAITITKTLMNMFMRTKLGEKTWLWGAGLTAHKEHRFFRIIEKTKVWFILSGTVLLISLAAFTTMGLKLGIDFKGGTLMDLNFEKNVTVEEIKAELNNISKQLAVGSASATPASGTALESADRPASFENSRIIPAGNNQFMINTEHIDNATHDKILQQLENKFGKITENRFTTIGPTVGDSLKRKAILAVGFAMIAIVLYIAFAFRRVPKKVSPWKFGVCAIAALLHDVLIPIGVFAVFGFEVDALFITAILTVIGFSVHDTIVVFDRIRENLKFVERGETFAHVANKSMSQTISRSINTSLTTIITLTALLIFGSSSISHFVLVLIIGIFVGTYSSIFIASPLLALWQRKQEL